MFKLKLASTTDKTLKAVLFHSDMTDMVIAIFSKNPNIPDNELKNLAYEAFDILEGSEDNEEEDDNYDSFEKYDAFLKKNNLDEANDEDGSLVEVTRESLIEDLEWELGLDEEDIEPSMVDESKIGWFADGVKLDVIDGYSDRF